MIKNNKTKKREITTIVVCVGPISGPTGPEFGPRIPLRVRLAQQAAGLARASQEFFKPYIFVPTVARFGWRVGEKLSDSLMSDSIPRVAKGFVKGGFDGARAELLAEYAQQSPVVNEDAYQKALKLALETSIKYLPAEHRHHVATQIKNSCGETMLNKVRDEFPQVPPNPDVRFYLYSFVAKFVDWAILCFVGFILLEAYLLGVEKFNYSYENRGELSEDEFLVQYFSKEFYLVRPLAFDYNSKNFVLNSCFIVDDIYLLNIDDNFPCE